MRVLSAGRGRGRRSAKVSKFAASDSMIERGAAYVTPQGALKINWPVFLAQAEVKRQIDGMRRLA